MATVAAMLHFQSEQVYVFLIYMSPWYFIPSFKSIGLSVQEKQLKKDVQDGGYGGHIGFSIETILAFLICKSA